jgi:hypothetical protein
MIPDPQPPRPSHRYFRCVPAAYPSLCESIDGRRGYPAGEGTRAPTLRALPEIDNTTKAENGDILICVPSSLIREEDEAMIDQAKAAGYVTELTEEEFAAAKPPSPPFP